MVDFIKLIQTRAFARQDGAILGAVWIASFAFTMWSVHPNHAFWGLLANLLIISTPFVVAKRLKAFRDYALDGVISFRRSLFYCWQTFFNATLLLTIVQFLWFKFLNTGVFMYKLMETYRQMMIASNMAQSDINMMMQALADLKPIAWASAFMITDLVVGSILSPIIAALMSRKVKSQQLTNQQGNQQGNPFQN